jgi:hypothetical protein
MMALATARPKNRRHDDMAGNTPIDIMTGTLNPTPMLTGSLTPMMKVKKTHGESRKQPHPIPQPTRRGTDCTASAVGCGISAARNARSGPCFRRDRRPNPPTTNGQRQATGFLLTQLSGIADHQTLCVAQNYLINGKTCVPLSLCIAAE